MPNKEMLGLGKHSSVIREIFEYSRKRKAQIGEDNVFDFSLGNPSIPTPQSVTSVMQRLVSERDPVSLHGYTSAPGDMGARIKIAENIEKLWNIKADPSLIYMTCGAAASLTVILKALLDEGDEVIVPTPFFPEYKVFIKNAGGVCIPVAREDGNFQLDIDGISSSVNEHTAAIIINSPNNPTGTVFTEESLVKLAAVLEKKSAAYGRPIYILSDEPYRELVYGGKTATPIPAIYRNTLVCYSYSKSLSLPGERIGYIFIPPAAEAADDLFAAVCGSARSLGFVCAPSLLQYTVTECDGTRPDISSYDRNRKLLYNSLTEMGYEAAEPDGAFYLFVKALESDAVAFCERAKRYELLLVPSDDFGCPGYVRIAYCVSYEQISRSLPAFEALYKEYKGEKI